MTRSAPSVKLTEHDSWYAPDRPSEDPVLFSNSHSAVLDSYTSDKLLQLLKLHGVCNRRLDRLQNESRKTLNLLALLTQFPASTERRTALQLQREREDKAYSGYQDCRRELIALITS